MAGVVAALAVSVTATGYTTAGADDQVKLSREEKLIAKGKTKVTKYFNSKGQLVAEAATKPEDTVTLVQAGDGAVEGINIKPYEPESAAEEAEMAAELTPEDLEQRRSLGAGATLPASGPVVIPTADGDVGLIYDTGCARIDGGEQWWYGCYERRSVREADDNYDYRLDSSLLSGRHRGWWGGITRGRTAHDYDDDGASVLVVKWSPTASLDTGNCKTRTAGFSYRGVNLSESYQFCPEQINPFIREQHFHSEWKGYVTDGDRTVPTHGFNSVRYASGKPTGFVYKIIGTHVDY